MPGGTMGTLRTWKLHFAAYGVLFVLLVSADPGRTMCDPTTDPDKTDIANARAAVAANCDCAGATNHGDYVSCAAQQAMEVLSNESCAGLVRRCAARST